MNDKHQGVGGRSVLRRVACPGPFQSQPADTSTGPQIGAQRESALADESKPLTLAEYMDAVRTAPYSGYAARPIDYPELREQSKPMPVNTYRCGWLFRWGSFWIGGHWSPHNKRLCVNVIPFVTFWITAPGGFTP